jgi:hypothetical protein
MQQRIERSAVLPQNFLIISDNKPIYREYYLIYCAMIPNIMGIDSHCEGEITSILLLSYFVSTPL